MARRRTRSSGKKTNNTPMMIIGGVAAVCLLALIFKGGGSSDSGTMKPTQSFEIANYRKDGSRFASAGNRYVLQGKVESIDTHDSDRLVIISLPGNAGERLPLLMPAENKSDVNVTRGDELLFEVTCKTGRTSEGEQVKGILVIKSIQMTSR